jgi:hypothetical protein
MEAALQDQYVAVVPFTFTLRRTTKVLTSLMCLSVSLEWTATDDW